ncbi:MAG: META domain-containing protein [Chloroflexi bacterium]|nr:META domain-containing protein [Chloroflexota bacterium]
MKKSRLFWTALLFMIGSMLAACSGSASTSLAGDWKLISYGSPANPTPALPYVETSLTFESDGTLGGRVGCNSFSGDYKVDGNAVTFGAIAATEMACDEPIMQQESAVFKVFIDSGTFKMNGNTLTILSADGNSVVVLSRK